MATRSKSVRPGCACSASTHPRRRKRAATLAAARGPAVGLPRGAQSLIAHRPVTCAGRGEDDYGRRLGVCSVSGRELNATLVREGLAWAFVKYAQDYEDVEGEARTARRGVFAAANTPPWEFRQGIWEWAAATAEADRKRKCPLKDDISSSGRRVYHMPWRHDYARTNAS